MIFDLLAQWLAYDDSQKIIQLHAENEYTNEHTEEYADNTF